MSGVWFSVSSLRFLRFVFSCCQVAIWLKDRSSDVNPQNNQPTNQHNEFSCKVWFLSSGNRNWRPKSVLRLRFAIMYVLWMLGLDGGCKILPFILHRIVNETIYFFELLSLDFRLRYVPSTSVSIVNKLMTTRGFFFFTLAYISNTNYKSTCILWAHGLANPCK